MKEIPQLLKGWRKANGMIQTQAAKMLGVSPNTLASWEAGRRLPEPWTMYKLYMHGRPDVAILAKDILKARGPEYELP